MIIDIVCTFSATTIEAEAQSISLVLTFPVTQLPSNICDDVKDCLGIDTINGEVDEFLNKRGQWVEISGGVVDSVNGQTGVVVLDADDIDDTTTSNKFVTQTQINTWNALIGGSIFQTVWNATTNTPTLSSGVGTKGYYYIVNVAGGTNLDGITDWKVGDWAIFDGTVWRKVDNTDAVSSVNGQTGAVSLTAANVGAPSGSGTSTGTNTGDQDLSGLQGKRIVVSGNTIAVNDAAYTLTANAIFADPTGVNGKGYSVLIRNGTATIGVTTYSTAGTLIWRVFNAGSWATYVLVNENQLNTKQDTLVSATNIKTVNGNSLLGSGDIVAGGSCDFISEATASNSAVIDFTLPTGYDYFELFIEHLIPQTNATSLFLRVSIDGGATFLAGASDYEVHRNTLSGPVGTIYVPSYGLAAQISFIGSLLGNTSGRFFRCSYRIFHPSDSAQNKNITGEFAMQRSDGQPALGNISARVFNTSAVNAIRLLMNSGNIASGTFKLYGYKS